MKTLPIRTPKAARGSHIHELALDQIVLDPALQPRAQIDLEIVHEYSEAMLNGALFPPVAVYFDRTTYWLVDGFHRVEAARRAGFPAIKAEVHLGTQREAMLYALGANTTHGLRRTNADKRKAALMMLADPEWCLWSDKEIARICTVSNGFVASLRRSSSALPGHNIQERINKKGEVFRKQAAAHEANGPPPAAFSPPSSPLTKKEIKTLYASKILKHLRQTDPQAQLDLETSHGTIDLATSTHLYQVCNGVVADVIYRNLGRLICARAALGRSDLQLGLIGRFPANVQAIVATLEAVSITCRSPDQMLAPTPPVPQAKPSQPRPTAAARRKRA